MFYCIFEIFNKKNNKIAPFPSQNPPKIIHQYSTNMENNSNLNNINIESKNSFNSSNNLNPDSSIKMSNNHQSFTCSEYSQNGENVQNIQDNQDDNQKDNQKDETKLKSNEILLITELEILNNQIKHYNKNVELTEEVNQIIAGELNKRKILVQTLINEMLK